MSKHRILVTGSTGMLGVSLVPYLRSVGHEVIGHGFSNSGDVNFDLSNYVETKNKLTNQKFSFAISLVAETNVDSCNKDPQKAYLLNVKSSEVLSKICAEKDARLIQISTDHIYDGSGPHAEENLTIRNMYALSKYAGELECKYSPSTILRTNFFGKSEHKTRKSFSDSIVNNLRNNIEMTIFNDVLFNPLSMKTLCKSIAAVISKPETGVFNLGSNDGFSKAEFALKFGEVLKLSTAKFKSVSVDTRTDLIPRPKDMRMNVSKFEKTFAIKLPTLYEEIVSQGEEYVRI